MTSANCTFNCSLVYGKPKYLHECIYCGFEVNLYESQYKCPICKRDTLCRAAQTPVWCQGYGSSGASLQTGFYEV